MSKKGRDRCRHLLPFDIFIFDVFPVNQTMDQQVQETLDDGKYAQGDRFEFLEKLTEPSEKRF